MIRMELIKQGRIVTLEEKERLLAKAERNSDDGMIIVFIIILREVRQ